MARANLVVLAFAYACGSSDRPSPPAPPAKVTAPINESELAAVTLTDAAVHRLAIGTAKLERRDVPRTRTYPGVIATIPGSGASITAPVAGLLVGNGGLLPGKRVAKGEVLLRIKPLVAAEADVLARAERDLSVAKTRVETARARAERVATLAKDGATSQRAAEEAAADYEVAKADLAEVTARSARVREQPFASDVALPLRTPDSGTVLRIGATPGQVVAAGASLVEIARVDRAWVRIAVYAGDVEAIDRVQAATIRRLVGRETRAVMPVEVPPLADPTSATVELVYAVDNADVAFLPGQRVLATVALAGNANALVVPTTSLLYDVHGGAWVYTVTGPGVFTRQRVEVRDVIGDSAVLERGPEPGTLVVTAGASELYGVEFGSR